MASGECFASPIPPGQIVRLIHKHSRVWLAWSFGTLVCCAHILQSWSRLQSSRNPLCATDLSSVYILSQAHDFGMQAMAYADLACMPAQAWYRKGAKLPPNLTGLLIWYRQLSTRAQHKDLKFVDTIILHECKLRRRLRTKGDLRARQEAQLARKAISSPCTVPSRKRALQEASLPAVSSETMHGLNYRLWNVFDYGQLTDSMMY